MNAFLSLPIETAFGNVGTKVIFNNPPIFLFTPMKCSHTTLFTYNNQLQICANVTFSDISAFPGKTTSKFPALH